MTADPGSARPRLVAAFDFDGTLTRRDSLFPFLVHARGPARVLAASGRVLPTAARGRLARRPGGAHPRDVVKARILHDLFAGWSEAELLAAGRTFAATLERRLRPDVVRLADWHRGQGHELVIVSASLLAYLEPFAAEHGFHHVIGVGLEAGPDGRLTGRLTGPNVRGPEKEVRLRAWLGTEPTTTLWAYGNSSGDTELLAMADHPVRITRAPTRTDANVE
ncbi:MAG: HAD-superfamily subfamily hydrolase [Acidimicrobiales bacterium]|nr:HAD-superfamily subfamily hydrolase [Acidimicrobiales bacterium]